MQRTKQICRIILLVILPIALILILPVGPAYAADTDNDGVEDASDNCPNDHNPDQKDTDGDREGDACDNDDDGDGVNDPYDNCPLTANTDQANTYGDARGNACEPETGQRLNGSAAPLVVYLINNTDAIQIYSTSGSKLGETSRPALQNLAAGGVGASTTIPSAGGAGLRITYNGGDNFTATSLNADGASGVSAPFQLGGVAQSTETSGTTSAASSPSMPETYTVKSGDTLTAIGRLFGVEVNELVKENNLANPNLILVGQVLRIPH